MILYMEKLIIQGGTRLNGKVRIDGAKNSAVALLPATLLADEGIFTISNLPNIEDIDNLIKTIEYLGGKVDRITSSTITIDNSKVNTYSALNEETRKMRASYYLLGPLLNKYGKVELNYPGGCAIGTRPIDLHLKGFKALGANVIIDHGFVEANTEKLVGSKLYLDFPSVGATENIMMAAALAEGTTIVENAAEEPEIVDLANFLNEMGADVKGAGTNTIRIKGVKSLKGAEHTVIPDRIEAATYMVAAAMTKGDITIDNVIMEHLKPVVAKLKEAGCEIIDMDNSVRVKGPEVLKPIDIKTLPHPGFPTDVQAQFMAMATVANGTGVVIETVFENRFMHVAEFNRMGANIKIEGRSAIVSGVDQLHGSTVKATDLRAGAALILCGLIAEGVTEIGDIYHIQRGYVDIDKKIQALGGNIEIIED